VNAAGRWQEVEDLSWTPHRITYRLTMVDGIADRMFAVLRGSSQVTNAKEA
jgi:hypothetical protein